jgi:YVTN family beta-propeller protein
MRQVNCDRPGAAGDDFADGHLASSAASLSLADQEHGVHNGAVNDPAVIDRPDDLIGYGPEPDYCGSAQSVIAEITLGGWAGDVVISPDNSSVYAAQNNSIAVIGRLNHIVGIIPVSGCPKRLTINVDGTRLYVSNYEGSVSVINIADHRIGLICAASCAQEVVTADRAFIYAAHNAKGRRASSVSVVSTDASTVVATADFDGCAITDLAVKPDGTRVYVGLSQYSYCRQYGTGLVAVLDTATCAVIDTIDLGASPDTVIVSPDGSMMYATHYDTEFVSAINLATHSITRIALADAPLELTFTPDGLQLYVGSRSSLSVIDTVTNETARITVGDLPRCVQISPDGKRAYVSNFGDHTVSVIDTTSQCVTDTINVSGHPEALAVSPDGERAYVSDYWSGIVTVIAT